MTLPVSELPPDVDHAVSFTSLTITPSVYLNRLMKQISSLSNDEVKIHRFHLPCLSFLSHPSITALIGQEPPAAVMICVGLGALLLGGVNDLSVYPTRGQVVKIRAPLGTFWIHKTSWESQWRGRWGEDVCHSPGQWGDYSWRYKRGWRLVPIPKRGDY